MNIRQPQQTERKIMSFTLIECLLVLWILTSLASLSVHGYQKMQQQLERARFFRQFESGFYLTIARAITTDAPSEMIINASGIRMEHPKFSAIVFHYPEGIHCISSARYLRFSSKTGNYAPASKVVFADEHARCKVIYSFYFGSGRYEKKIIPL